MSINNVCISGNLTRDPELKSTAAGTSVLEFSVAVNDRRRNQATGEWEDVANYVECSVFGKRAEALSRLVSKGSKVFVSGRLRYSSWEKDGHKRSKLSVMADEVEIMPKGGQRPQDASEAPQKAYDEGLQTMVSDIFGQVYEDDGIPF